jgi:hypothetical protein
MFLAYLKAEVIRPPSKVDPRMSEAPPERERELRRSHHHKDRRRT